MTSFSGLGRAFAQLMTTIPFTPTLGMQWNSAAAERAE